MGKNWSCFYTDKWSESVPHWWSPRVHIGVEAVVLWSSLHSDAWVGFLDLHSHTSWWCPSPTQGWRVLHTMGKMQGKACTSVKRVEESVGDWAEAGDEAQLHTALADLMTLLDDSIQKMTGKANLVMFSKHVFEEQRTPLTHQVAGKRRNKSLCFVDSLVNSPESCCPDIPLLRADTQKCTCGRHAFPGRE